MPRKPITAYAGGKGPRQQAWEAIRAMGMEAEWEKYDIARKADLVDQTVGTYLQALVKAGIVVETRREKVGNVGVRIWYRLAIDKGVEAPRLRRDGTEVTQGLAQEQMWRTLRMLQADTNARELAAHASTPAIPVAEAAAVDYLKVLFAADYLACTKEGQRSGKAGILAPARYRLKAARNTGPRPPMVCRTRVLYDPNLDDVVWAARVTDEDAIHGQ